MLIQRALGGEMIDEAVIRKGLEFFLSYYREHKLDHTTVYDGIADALTAIENAGNGAARKLVVLSNKPTRVIEIIELKTTRPRPPGYRELDTHRQKLVKLFRSLEQPAV